MSSRVDRMSELMPLQPQEEDVPPANGSGAVGVFTVLMSIPALLGT